MRLTLFILLFAAPGADACSVPVFRYALERWAPSPYEVLVFHDRPLTDAESKRLTALEEAKLNVVVRPVDVREPMKPMHKAILGDHPTPYVSVRFPDSDENTPAAWSGFLADLPTTLGDSPARRDLVTLLAKGTSVVWILLDGDEATEKMLRGELTRLEKTLELPEVDPADLKTRLPLKLSFAVLKIARKGPEADLARELLDNDEELRLAKGPVIFPVVGRGRMLFGLHGKGLTEREVASSASFACGACSCQVKELNPGVDLLLRADWQGLLDVTDAAAEVTAPTAPPIPPGRPEPAPDRRAEVVKGGWIVPAALIGLVALALGWHLATRRSS